MSATTAHLILAIALLCAYVALTVAGFDGNEILAVLGGQATGAGIQAATAKK